jgi:2'-5' RNA ligase
MTLARQVSRPVESRELREPLALIFERFSLMKSRPGHDGVSYGVVESWPLSPTEPA